MRLALISFEYPPAVAVGGIGTYALEAARMLAQNGVDVEVFSAGKAGTTTCEAAGIPVHRVTAKDRAEFSERIAPVLVRQHRQKSFDVLESPEIGAEGAVTAAALPEIARVVKLHTPTYLVGRVGYEPPTLGEKLRFSLGALRRGRIHFLQRPPYDAEADRECSFARQADEVAAPSRAIAAILQQEWSLAVDRVSCFPLPLSPSQKLLALPLAGQARTIGFLGRLEARKGVVELARAIPAVLKEAPATRFRFIGPSWPYKQSDMQQWITTFLAQYRGSLEFTGAIKPAQLPEQLAQCDVVVLPSRWENFPFACSESLASGRAVIGSAAGGMAEMIEPGKNGLLVPPGNPAAIAAAILSLVKNAGMVRQYAEAGRKSIVELLNPERVLPLQIASYERAMARARERMAVAA